MCTEQLIQDSIVVSVTLDERNDSSRTAQPTAAIIDSRTLRSTPSAVPGALTSGEPASTLSQWLSSGLTRDPF